MKALIMAAGAGTRISRHLQGQPKCCVDVGGQPLIRHTLNKLRAHGIRDIALVTGYQEHFVHRALEGYSYARYFNPFYRVANSVSSVWFAREFLNDAQDLLIMNGDVYMEDKVLESLLADSRSPLMLADSTRIEDADYRFRWVDDRLHAYGKELSNEDTTGEYVGVGRLIGDYIELFRQRVVDAVVSGDYGCWWEDVIYRTIAVGDTVHVRDIAGLFWAEVDYIEDYERIKAFATSAKTVA